MESLEERYRNVRPVSVRLLSAVVSMPHEDRLLEQLLRSNKHNLLNIPVADVGECLHVELGLVLKKIIKVVRYTAKYNAMFT